MTSPRVRKEPLGAISLFSSNGMAKTPHRLIGKREDWEVNLPNTSERIYSSFLANRIPMYEAVFQEVGFRLPFSSFQVSVFKWMELCPSQLHPDSFAFMVFFELVCRFLHLPPTKDLFSPSLSFSGGQIKTEAKTGSPSVSVRNCSNFSLVA